MAAGRRNTQQRKKIREVFEKAGRPLNVEEVHSLVREIIPGLGIATVYRNLKALLDEGAIQLVSLPGENPRYETRVHGHHHHFQCTACERVFDVHACPGDLSRLAPAGFTVEDHELTLYGRCRECQPPPARRQRPSSSRPG